MTKPGDIISHSKMSLDEGYSLQRGMNFRVKGGTSVFLMSLRKGAPYADSIKEEGKILIYEGHDVPKNVNSIPKTVDQPLTTPYGRLTENGKFFQAAQAFKNGGSPELIKVYEKIKDGIWVFNGVFELLDAWTEDSKSEKRKVFKFKLQIIDESISEKNDRIEELPDLEHNRIIPTDVKLEVYKRDKGRCTTCGSNDNLHFDHIFPFSKGGTSLLAANIQLLCARHNLGKRDRIV